MSHFDFRLEDFVNDKNWTNAVITNQNPEGKALKTSASERGAASLSVTTFTLSNLMQGAGLYKPQNLVLSQYNQKLSREMLGLYKDEGNKFDDATTALLPYDVLLQFEGEPEGSGAYDPSAQNSDITTSITGGFTGQGGRGSNPAGTKWIPPEYAQYGNGKIPESMMAPIPINNLKMYPPAASAFRQMYTALTAAGLNTSASGTYRSYAAQVDMKRRRGKWAAKPGSSNHGWGLAIDLSMPGGNSYNHAVYKWLNENGPKYGFYNPPSLQQGGSLPEPWHWEWRPTVSGNPQPNRNSSSGSGAGGTGKYGST